MNSSQARFEWLDCVRGYAIAAVTAAHVGFFPAGGRGVQLFFVASAISLMYSHLQHHEAGTAPFFIRRLFRIMPMLWLAIVMFYIGDLATNESAPDLWQVISTALLLPSAAVYRFQNAAVPGSWSIACEACFYLLFPLVTIVITTSKRALVGWLGSIAFAAACWPFLVRYAGFGGADSLAHQHQFAFLFPTSQFPCFAIGILVFLLLQERRPFAGEAGLIGLCGLAALCFGENISDRLYLLWISAFGLIAFALANGHLRFVVNRPVRLLGLISYSAYYWHLFAIDIVHWIFPSVGSSLAALLVIAMTLPCATLTYLTVERPMMRLGAKLASLVAKSEAKSAEMAVMQPSPTQPPS
jgi:peptidoglycan/LPS O-acetylase OafA/YrhL